MPFPDTGLGIDINFESLEGLIGNRGTKVVHEISLPCPCRSTSSDEGAAGHPDPTCGSCLGRGKVFRAARKITGLVTGLSNNRLWAQVGWIQPGDMSFSPSLHARRINDFDRITITVPIPVEGQVLTRGVADSFSFRPSDLKANEDLLYWEAGRRTAVWVEDEDGVVYDVPEYCLEGRKVVWATGGGPANGKKYSIKYEGYPEYIAFSTPFDRWDRQRELGQRVMLRRAVLDLATTDREIRPPWDDLLDNDPHKSRTDVYSNYNRLDTKSVDSDKN